MEKAKRDPMVRGGVLYENNIRGSSSTDTLGRLSLGYFFHGLEMLISLMHEQSNGSQK